MNRLRIVIIIVLAIIAAGAWGTSFSLSRAAADDGNRVGQITHVETIEQTESQVPEAFVKEEYIPIIPEGVNIADLSRFDSNGYNDVYLPGKAKDGDTKGASYWEGKADDYPNILTAVFSEEQSVHAIKLLLCPLSIWSTRIQSFSVKVSYDGESFEEIIPNTDYTFDPNKGNEVVIEFDKDLSVMAISLEFTQNTGAVGAQVAEFEIYSR